MSRPPLKIYEQPAFGRLFAFGRQGTRGFTLLEIMAVLVIVGIVLTFVALSAGGDSRLEQMQREADKAVKEADGYWRFSKAPLNLGVMVTIVTGRLQGRQRRIRMLRATYRASVLVFGVGLSALFSATLTIGVPTYAGVLVGLGGGVAITSTLFVRALRLQ